eukprot:24571_1
METFKQLSSNPSTYTHLLGVLRAQRMIWFGICFGIDIYDTYLRKYPSPNPTDVQLKEHGAFGKYEGLFGRLCWMALCYRAWGLLLKKNIQKAQKYEPLSKFEIGCIASVIAGFGLRILCKYIMGKKYTYSIVVYKEHEIQSNGPYNFIRHPGMFGLLINFGGTCAWLNNWWGWAVYGVLLRDIYITIQDEEKCLSKMLGKKHKTYVEKVPYKIIPYIW